MRLLDAITKLAKTLRQFRPVDRADGHLAPIQPVIDHRPPLAVPALDHVGDHAMGMKLRIEVARGVVPERGGDHLLPAGADHAAIGRVLHPGLDRVRLDPGEGAPHSLVMRGDDPRVAADQGHQRDRLRRGQGDVTARPVVNVAVPVTAAELPPAWNLTLEDRREGVGGDRTGQPKRRRALARPGARLTVRRIIPGVVAVALVVGDTLRRRRNLADRRYHRGRAETFARLCSPCPSMYRT